MVSIHFNCVEKSSLDSALNIYFCVLPQKVCEQWHNIQFLWARERERDELEVLW